MSGAWVRTRKRAGGNSYLVCYRLGGRGRILYAGTWQTKKLADVRRDFVAGEIAAGRDPRVALTALAAPAPVVRTLGVWARLYADSRVDLAANSLRNLSVSADRLGTLADRDPATVTPADIQARIAELMRTHKPSTVKAYVKDWRLILDFAQIAPNPARHPSVKLPRQQREEVTAPTGDEFLRILDKLPARYRLLAVTLEQTAMRVGEACALEWGDLDAVNQRFRLRAETVKTRRARFVQIPDWLLPIIEQSCPLEDRTAGRRVFQGISRDVMYEAMARACRYAGVPVYGPHSLRHRRASLWHAQGVSARELAHRGGWSNATVPLSIYSHLLGDAEIRADQLTSLLVRTG